MMKTMMMIIMMMVVIIRENALSWGKVHGSQLGLGDMYTNNNDGNKNDNIFNDLSEDNDEADNDIDETSENNIFYKICCENENGENKKNNIYNIKRNDISDSNILENIYTNNGGEKGELAQRNNLNYDNNLVIDNDNYYNNIRPNYYDNHYENNDEDVTSNDIYYNKDGDDRYNLNEDEKDSFDEKKDYDGGNNNNNDKNGNYKTINDDYDEDRSYSTNYNNGIVDGENDGNKDDKDNEFYYHWLSFILQHDKVYQNKTEENRRQKIFYKNIEYINRHNDNKERQFTLSMNEFSDLTLEEHQSVRNIKNLEQTYPGIFTPSFTKPLPQSSSDSLDWRTLGAVTTPKQQGSCGACYAFSVAGVVEGCHFRKTNNLIELSAQNLLDCNAGNCEDGGSPINAYQYVMNNGIDADANYPYVTKKETCKYNRSGVVASINGFYSVKQSEEDLKMAVTHLGPLSVGIHSSLNSFLYYSNGIYNDKACTDKLNHDVLLVGYGQNEAGTKYWIIKNSWGESWGENGYMYLERDAGNLCGISTFAQGATC